jgi:hypothetical protein
MGGRGELLEILANGPVRALRNWPSAAEHIRAGNVEARPVLEAGKDPAESTWWTYTLSNLGRRRRSKFWGVFA